MVGPSRYSLSGAEAGLQGGILKNKLGISDQRRLDDTETVLLADTYEHFFSLQARGELRFDLSLLFQIHKYFLLPLYSWAGKIRTVDVSKDGMLFASVRHIQASLETFDKVLQDNLPQVLDSKKIVAAKIALIHCELNAIHPFREGNGRTIRLFLDLLVANAGYNPIDWSKRSQAVYIQACVFGMKREYVAMEKIVYAGLTKSSR